MNEWDCQDICRVLCDTTCIESIYSSNHTLDVLLLPFYFRGEDILDEIASSLEMNHNEDKAEVARQKILTYHFSEEGKKTIHVFAHMPVTTIPVAIAWIGRDRIEFTLMYDVVRAVPALFERLAGSGQNEEDVNMQY